MIKRTINFLNKPILEQKRLIKKRIGMLSTVPFYFGKANLSFTFLGYQPDSYVYANKHKEFASLFKSFTANNKYNNSGDVTRLWSLILNIKQILIEDIPGDFAELGVWRGNSASILAYYAAISGRRTYLFDTYQGFDERDFVGVDEGEQMAFADTSLAQVKNNIGTPSMACSFVKGRFPDSIMKQHKENTYSIVSLDCDLYEPMKAGLDFFYPLMSRGGIILIHDYSSALWQGVKKAVDDFLIEADEYLILMPDKSGSAFIRKSK